jgi:glycogen(starch) synthase
MKILMFGWEFPPHISGGLGTACEGIIGELARRDVKVVFVVPKRRGNEDDTAFTLLDASRVPILPMTPFPTHTHSEFTRPGGAAGPGLSDPAETTVYEPQNHFTRITVPANLKPYEAPSAQENDFTVTMWSSMQTALMERIMQPSQRAADDKQPAAPLQSLGEGRAASSACYEFSGGYGPTLFDETMRYAEIASHIACTHDVDLIHVHDWMTFPAGVAAKKVSGKKLIAHVHATEVDRSGKHPHPVIFSIERDGLHQADHIVAVSGRTRRVLIERYQIDKKKISVIHNGVTMKEGRYLRSAPRIGSHLVTFLGRITYQKGPAYFVDAAARVVTRFPDAHFLIAGAGDLLPKMVERVAGLKLSANFHFSGFVTRDEIAQAWAMSDVYVMPSVSEPFGITPLEAIQAGVPVIISNQSGVSEVLQHAIKVDFWDVDALANAICSVLTHQSLTTTLRKESQGELRNITWAQTAEKLLEVYRRTSIINSPVSGEQISGSVQPKEN